MSAKIIPFLPRMAPAARKKFYMEPWTIGECKPTVLITWPGGLSNPPDVLGMGGTEGETEKIIAALKRMMR
jgi:hypothetical protein